MAAEGSRCFSGGCGGPGSRSLQSRRGGAGFLYGDRDSTAPGAWEEFVRKGARAKTYPVNKDDTDLSLVLQDLPGDRTVLATGIWGGRADHLFGNLYTLLAYVERGGSALLAGVRWPLDRAELTQANPYAVSNKMTGNVLHASCQKGIAGVYFTWKE